MHVYVCIYMYVCMYMYVCTMVCIMVCVMVCIMVCICMHMYVYVCICMYMYIYIYTCICICIYIYIYVCIIYVYICNICVYKSSSGWAWVKELQDRTMLILLHMFGNDFSFYTQFFMAIILPAIIPTYPSNKSIVPVIIHSLTGMI